MILNFNVSFANGQLPVYSSTPTAADVLTSPVYVYYKTKYSGSAIDNYTYYSVNLDGVDYFYFKNNSNNYYAVFLSNNSFNIYYVNSYEQNSINNTTSNNTSNGYYYFRNNLSVFYTDNVYDSSIPYLGQFSTVDDAIYYFINNGVDYGSSSVVGDGYLTNGLPVGNVIYFDLGSSEVEYDITLKSYFTSKSSWFGNTWVNDNRRYGFTDELPTTATNFSESSGSSIPWSPSGSTDLLGRSDEGSAIISGTSTGRYLWILNPLYNLGYYDEPDKGTSLNGNIFYIGGISVDTPYYLYSLKQSATSLGLSSDVASSVGGVGSVTSSGAINTVVNDGSGTEYVPSVGGDNSAPPEVSASEGIKQTLDQFVQMFLNIFTAPISHIQQLISAGSEFISHISGLWAWLPSEVSGFVLSAFVVMVAISIFKLFL